MFTEFGIAKAQAEDRHDQSVMLAWRVAFFSRLKTLGDPTQWLSKSSQATAPPQSPQEQLTVVRMLAEMGGRLTTRAEREAEKAQKQRAAHGQ